MTLEKFAQKHRFLLSFEQVVIRSFDQRGRLVRTERSWTCTLKPPSVGTIFEIEYQRKPREEVRIVSGPLFPRNGKSRKACRDAMINEIRGNTLSMRFHEDRWRAPRSLA